VDQGSIEKALSPYGTLKNPVLFSSGTFSGSMLFFGQQHTSEAAGFLMIILATLVFLCGMGFYVYAFLRLPTNTQQQLFLQEARVAVAQHDAATRRRRAGRRPAPVPEQEA
jgi:hypothetical protein